MRLPLLTALFLVWPLPAFAQESAQDRTDRIVFGAGLYNVTDAENFQRDPEFRAEWRLGSVPVWKFHPWLGLELTQGNVGWFGGGLETDIDLTDWLVLTLQSGFGYFDDGTTPFKGWRYNPNSGPEFRHQIELAVRFPQGNRVGVGFSHMSNGGFFGKSNPAMESLSFNFHIPLGVQVGRRPAPLD